MNRGYLYLVISVSTFALGFFSPAFVSVILFWTSLAALYFAIGYLTHFGALLLKSRKGKLPVIIKLFLLPVLLGVTIYNLIYRMNDQAPPFQNISEGLWLSRRLVFSDNETLKDSGINAILDVTAEFDAIEIGSLQGEVEYFNIPVMDHNSPSMSQLNKAVLWIKKQRDEGREVLIHCALGQGRSVTVLLAYLATVDLNKSLKEHLNFIKAIRKTANPNKKQLRKLRQFVKNPPIVKHESVYVLFNPQAGNRNKEKDLIKIKDHLSSFPVLKIWETTEDEQADQLAKRAIDEGATIIVAAGGDGTVMQVASQIIGSNVSLGIIPLGTANALAACLYGNIIHFDPIIQGCQHVLSGKCTSIDMARCNDRYMLLLAGFGMERGMVEKANEEFKENWGAFGYLIGGWQQLEEQQLFDIKLSVDGVSHQFKTGSVTVANAAPLTSILAHGNSLPIPADGLLDVTIIVNIGSKSEAMGIMMDLIGGLNQKKPGNKILHFQGKQIEITTEPPQKLVLDGEIYEENHTFFQVLPRSLKVMRDN